jgi:hypothetical protein
MEENNITIESGLYHVNMRGATVGECWRLGKTPLGFLLGLYMKLTGENMAYTWFPFADIRRDCSFDELKPLTREKLNPLIEQAKPFGFKNGRFTNIIRTFNKNARESGSYMALHDNRKQVLIGAYALSINKLLPEVIIERISIQVVSVLDEMKYIGAHNNDLAAVSGGISRCVYIPHGRLEDVIKKCNEELQKTKSSIITFKDLNHYDDVTEKIEKKVFLFHINRGYYQKADSQTQESVLKEFGYV